ncbi:hypothetical protein INT46_007909 [Mucor plumbeus]|uniref:Transposase Tc1-like domain-containing protein n=1 Tax=Mucor plumbeus TaxID=97098 RepID=A0A8H7UX45_9FUNG|nr:hypothetical protein INT46_007909 [Mucor plumbeus]
MAPHLTSNVKNFIKSLLFNNASFSAIQKLYPAISLSGRRSKTSKSTKSYIAKQLRTDRSNGPRGMQEHLRMEGVDMSLSGIRKGLKKRGFNVKRKIKINFASKENEAEKYAWAKKYRNYTLKDWCQWVFSEETRVNIWGTDGNSFV